jgi:hypothetical protein
MLDTPDQSEPFDPARVAAEARGEAINPRTSETAPLTGAEARRTVARINGWHGPAAVWYPLPDDAALSGRPEFADLAAAVAGWREATRRRQDAQDNYEDAEAAYRTDLGAWERGQRALAEAVAAGGEVPAEIPPRPVPTAYESRADLLARVAGEAARAEDRAVAAVNAACEAAGKHLTAWAAERQQDQGERARRALADALAQVDDLISAHETAYFARTAVTADELAETERRGASYARSRHGRERAAVFVAEGFHTRRVTDVSAMRRRMADLRADVEALAGENFAADWPVDGDPVAAARRIAANPTAAARMDAARWHAEERALADRAFYRSA